MGTKSEGPYPIQETAQPKKKPVLSPAETLIFTLGAFSIVDKSFGTPTLGRQVNTMYNLALEQVWGKTCGGEN